nr:uncharacterized protein LOC105326003 isoform X2 [Crassostrea gigas]
MTNTFAFIVVVCVCMNVQVYSAGCRVGWIQFQSKCYWFSHESKPWGEAGVLDAMWDGFGFRTNVTGSAMTQDLGEKQSFRLLDWYIRHDRGRQMDILFQSKRHTNEWMGSRRT